MRIHAPPNQATREGQLNVLSALHLAGYRVGATVDYRYDQSKGEWVVLIANRELGKDEADAEMMRGGG